jgi:phospholipase C
MSSKLDAIDTIIVVMMENRSFDHMLGYLSLPPWNRADVEGLKKDPAFQMQFGNHDKQGKAYQAVRFSDPSINMAGDPPHERPNIETQLGMPVNGVFPMNGFVQSYPQPEPLCDRNPLVMGYFTGDQLPTFDFFARSFAICDHWFCPLPAGTQPNRLMAMGGATLIDVNKSGLLDNQDLVYDWLNRNNVRWRVYHDKIPFFALMPKWIPSILQDDHFQSFSHFASDVLWEKESFPQVIFIEPSYTDSPHKEFPNDDHAPTAASNGQDFLLRIYNALIANPARWSKTALIITYDEHGGFFDHVSPLPLRTFPPRPASYEPFHSSGPRVPGFVISPLVEAGSVFKGNLDHTSILKFIAEKFGHGSYSADVDARKVGSVSEVLTRTLPRTDLPHIGDQQPSGFTPGHQPAAPMPAAFQAAWDQIKNLYPEGAARKFPDLMRHF